MGSRTEAPASRQNGVRPLDGVDSRSSLPTDPRVYLATAVAEHRALVASGAFDVFREATGSSERFLDRFQKSEFFRSLYGVAVQEALRINTIVNPGQIDDEPPLTDNQYVRKLKGLLCEGMAYVYITAQNLHTDQVVLSPMQTHDFLLVLYPTALVVKHPFGQKALYKTYQPDGLVVDPRTMQTTEMLESKAYNGWHSFESQYRGFNSRREEHPSFFQNAQQTLVVPQGFRNTKSAGYKNVAYEFFPITDEQLADFTDRVFRRYSPDGQSATLADMLRYRDERLSIIENHRLNGSGHRRRFDTSRPLAA